MCFDRAVEQLKTSELWFRQICNQQFHRNPTAVNISQLGRDQDQHVVQKVLLVD